MGRGAVSWPPRPGSTPPAMRKPISPRTHGLLDYATVAVFALAPVAFGLEGLAAGLSYGLAAVHLAMTLGTAFPMGVVRVVSFPGHGAVELAVGVALLLAAFFLFSGAAFWFYAVMGLVILTVWAGTDYAGRGALT